MEIFRSGEARAFRQIRRERIWAALLAEGRGTGCAESKAQFTRSLPLRGPAFEKGDDCMDAGRLQGRRR